MHTLNHNQDVTITKISGTEDKEVDPTTGVEVDELWRQRHDKNKHIKGYVLSMRQTSKPKYLEDYVLLAEEEGEMLLLCLNNEPRNFEEARELDIWIEACKDHINSIEKNEVWSLVDLPVGVKPIGLIWIFKIKRNTYGTINKYKSRLVAKGYVQQYGSTSRKYLRQLQDLKPSDFLLVLLQLMVGRSITLT